jgi:hypothetical protein
MDRLQRFSQPQGIRPCDVRQSMLISRAESKNRNSATGRVAVPGRTWGQPARVAVYEGGAVEVVRRLQHD